MEGVGSVGIPSVGSELELAGGLEVDESTDDTEDVLVGFKPASKDARQTAELLQSRQDVLDGDPLSIEHAVVGFAEDRDGMAPSSFDRRLEVDIRIVVFDPIEPSVEAHFHAVRQFS